MALRDYIHALLDLFYPRYCLHCNAHLNDSQEMYLCPYCKKTISFIRNDHCIRCGTALGPHMTSTIQEGCPACKGKHFSFDTITSITRYDGVTKTLIHKFKYAKQKFVVSVLNNIVTMHTRFEETPSDIDIIVPVPLFWLKKLHRGFNQSELLSLGIQRHLLKPISRNNLCRIKNTVSQTQLSRAQRRTNIHNAFFVKNPSLFKDKKILLVDDVLTTGVTASECSKKLKESGAESVHVFVLAKAEYNT